MNEHADRDHSEAPDLLAALQRSVDNANAGTSRPVAARATPAQVEAAMEALDCRREFDELTLTMFCGEHHVGWLSDAKACARAERVADAVVAADAEQAELRAEVERLTKARDAWQRSAKGARREFVETHDLLEAAERALADERARVAEVVARWEADRDVCLAWIADPTKHVDEQHPVRLSGMADILNRHAQEIRAVALAGPEPEATEGGAS